MSLQDKTSLPEIIIITDSLPSKNGGGISQTLFNLFDQYPKEKLYCFVDKNEVYEESEVLQCIKIKYKHQLFPTLNNRIGIWTNSFFELLNASILDILRIKFRHLKNNKHAYILVSTTIFEKLHIAYRLHVCTELPIITYFMDDWMAGLKKKWLTGDLQNLVEKVLRASVGWMMISDNLIHRLSERYQVENKKSWVVHNPVDVAQVNYDWENIRCSEPIKVVYAGSIWPMHYDALLLCAKTIFHLQKEKGIDVKLLIHCQNHFWKKYEQELLQYNVFYKGFVQYDYLQEALTDATFLLVTSSFLEQYESFTYSSVQTKLTDYMRIGKPVLAIGPSFSACNQFVKKWNCGYTIESGEIQLAMNSMEEIILDKIHYSEKGLNGYQIVKEYFSKQIIQQQLYSYLQSLSSSLN